MFCTSGNAKLRKQPSAPADLSKDIERDNVGISKLDRHSSDDWLFRSRASAFHIEYTSNVCRQLNVSFAEIGGNVFCSAGISSIQLHARPSLHEESSESNMSTARPRGR